MQNEPTVCHLPASPPGRCSLKELGSRPVTRSAEHSRTLFLQNVINVVQSQRSTALRDKISPLLLQSLSEKGIKLVLPGLFYHSTEEFMHHSTEEFMHHSTGEKEARSFE
ncbi:unnamed protein product [Protopolystoma xenopodis]|uniref:Uncharacterized protein n=1 Tax=Protopolystoma xenopodis TaxID=117903 RepID=A0A3S5APT6_9PLAT|nr:unnamed protein product [Protopolystoma xenopodis]